MRPYADVPSRRMIQIFADILAILAIIVFVRTGMAVHDKIASFAVWGERISAAGERLGGSLTNIGETLGNIPLVGELIAGPFNNAAGAAEEWEKVGADIESQVQGVAVTLGLGAALVPIGFLLLIWLVPRLRFAVRAARVRSVATSPAGLDLLALRAIANAPVKDLQRISPHVAEAWRVRDPGTIKALATLELERAGVKIPPAKATPEPPAYTPPPTRTAAPAAPVRPAVPAAAKPTVVEATGVKPAPAKAPPAKPTTSKPAPKSSAAAPKKP